MKKKKVYNNTLNSPITKKVLQQELDKLEERVDEKFDKKLFKHKIEVFALMSQMEQQAKDRETEYHSAVMSSFDKVMERLDSIQTEMTVGFSQMNGRSDNHEKRIRTLESAQKAI